ncbi:helix-turn-helix transcriptional regulator [Blautia pseudococcoides]|uniref:helix-turn-helix transcriptional regulator n=1 Tax=Blautia pseudococcoides TaxID=1796616 RepID=UPI003516F9AC
MDNKIDRKTYSLKELRARKNLTQKQVANSLGVSTQTYNSWEKDISNVAVSKVQLVANFYGVKIDEIFF